jgi:prepilin peptidase CpaA
MSVLALVQTSCLAIFALLLIGAGWQDLRTLRIANRVSLATVAAFSLWAAAGVALGRMSSATVALSITCSLLVFAIAASGFVVGVIGGGDVKLLSAATLFAGPAHAVDFLVVTGLVGGGMGLALLVGVPIGPGVAARDGTAHPRLRSSVPYGPAIAAGGLWVVAALYAS